MNNLNILFLILLTNLLVLNSRAQSTISDYNGIYTLGKKDIPLDADTYTKTFIKGGALRISWSLIEPIEGDFDWSFLENEILTAQNAEKKVTIYIHTGYGGTPEWVYDAGAQKYFYIDENQNHDTFGKTLYFPFPWDAIYLEKWKKFIQEFGNQFGNNTTISYVRGATESITNGWNLPKKDANDNDWNFYNYTPTLLLNAMKDVLDEFMSAFPNTPHWAEVGPIKFEAETSGNSKVHVANEITNYGLQNYASRFGLWREDVHCNVPLSPNANSHWKFLKNNTCRTGAQMLAPVSNPNGLNRMRKCDTSFNAEQALEAAIQMALDYEMPYVEVYIPDVLNPDLETVLQNGANSLASSCGQSLSVDDENNLSQKFIVFPNPSTGEVLVQLENITKIEVYNSFGQRILLKLNSNNINLSEQPKGIYFIKIITSNRERISKIILK